MRIAIYQIVPELDTRHLLFRDREFAERITGGHIVDVSTFYYCDTIGFEKVPFAKEKIIGRPCHE